MNLLVELIFIFGVLGLLGVIIAADIVLSLLGLVLRLAIIAAPILFIIWIINNFSHYK